MTDFEHALLLLLIVAGLSVAGRWLPWPPLITYLLGGVGAAFLPWFPRFQLDPQFFFLCFLPPLLFSDGWLMPIRELLRAKRPILMLAIGLVTFTTLAVGLVAHALVPGLPLAMAFALGAIVSPTDAVAVSSATESLRIPARMTTILNGESLMNDATGLVAFKFALAAVIAGSFSPGMMVLEFSLLSFGGFAIGLAVGYAVGRLRDLLRSLRVGDTLIETTLSLMTPYAAYLLAEHLRVSGVLSVVAAGLYSGWRDPVRMDVEARQTAFGVWSLVIFWLNGIAFVLLGLQFPGALLSREPPVHGAPPAGPDGGRRRHGNGGSHDMGVPGHVPAVPTAGRTGEGDPPRARPRSLWWAGPECAGRSPSLRRFRSRSCCPAARRFPAATSSSSWPSG